MAVNLHSRSGAMGRRVPIRREMYEGSNPSSAAQTHTAKFVNSENGSEGRALD